LTSSNGGGAAPRASRDWLAPLSSRLVFLGAAAALVAAGLVPVLVWGGNLDAAWYLYVARRVLAGAHLYRDIVEVNPPLIVALSVPPAWLARELGVLDLAVYDLAAAALAALSVGFAGSILMRLPGALSSSARRALLLLLLAALFPLAAADFGQREHLLLALVLPYLCLSAVRAEGRVVPGAEAIAAGVMAGVGLCLKPFYLPLWVAVEAYLAVGRRAGPPWRRAETPAIGAVLVLYGAAVVAFAPGYLSLVGRLGPLYASLLRVPLAALIASPDGALPLLAVAALAVTPRSGALRSVGDVMLIAVATSLLAVLLQEKGWSYHYYPSRAESLLALGVVPLSAASAGVARARALAARLTALLLAAGLAVVLVQRGREAVAAGSFEREVIRGEMTPLVRRYAAGKPILALTVSPTPAFPLVNFSGADWALRFPSLWMIPALAARGQWVVQRPGAPPATRSPLQQYLIDAVTDDLISGRPALIVFYAPPWGAPDLVGYFASVDSRFAAALSHYRLLADVSGYRFLVRTEESS